MKKRWPAIILALVLTLSITASSMAEPARAGSQAAIQSAQRVPADQEFDPIFQEVFEGLPIEASDAQLNEMMNLLLQIMALESEGDSLEAEQQWEQLFGLIDPLWQDPACDDLEFQALMEGFLPGDISDADRAELERLFDEAVALEEQGDWEEAEEAWAAFDALLEEAWENSEQDWWDEECWDEECL